MRLSRRLIKIFTVSLLVLGLGLLSVACLPATTTDEGAATTTEAGGEGTNTFSKLFSSYGTWIWLAILVVAFYFLLIRPQRMRSKKAQDLMSSLQRGDEVVTVGGFHGRIKDIRDDAIIITIASGVDVKVSKSAVSKKTSQ